MFSIDGLATGLDTAQIIEGLLALRQSQIDRLQSQKQGLLTKQSAFAGIEAKLLQLKGTLSRLGNAQSPAFSVRTATSSDESIVTAAATSRAATGSLQLRVQQLARTHQIASAGFASEDTIIRQGTLSIHVGSGPTVDVVIDSQNATVRGLAQAINDSAATVSAALVNDGTTTRIVLTGEKTGAEQTIVLDNQLTTGSGDAPNFSGPALQTAADAEIAIGEGAAALVVTHPTNLVDDLLQGLTLDLRSADPDQTVTITVGRDLEAARDAINDFVGAYNEVVDMIAAQTKFESETGAAGVLLGFSPVNDIQRTLAAAMSSVLGTLPSRLNRLSSAGIAFDDRGRLTLDTARLDPVLAGTASSGATIDDLEKLFGLTGSSSHPDIEFLFGSAKTRETAAPYEVVVTRAAERAVLTAGTPLAATVSLASDLTLSLQVDGRDSSTLTLAAGDYTRQEFADALDAAIAADPALSGFGVAVSLDNNALRLQSDSYGSSSKLLLAGSDLSPMGFTGSPSDQGVDVAGYFVADGTSETATGRGQLLSADSDNTFSAGLQVSVRLTPAQISGTHSSQLTVTRGFAARLDVLLEELLDNTQGKVHHVYETFEQQIDSVDQSTERVEAAFEAQRTKLLADFAALESTVNALRNTSNFLASQLVSLTLNPNKN